VSTLAIPPTATQAALPKADSPAKIHEAAQQFEALLIGQILETVAKDGAWLGSGADSASSCANGFAQQQLAVLMARNGGFGLAKMIEHGLENKE
jgi:Rod binding domain-containing protein